MSLGFLVFFCVCVSRCDLGFRFEAVVFFLFFLFWCLFLNRHLQHCNQNEQPNRQLTIASFVGLVRGCVCVCEFEKDERGRANQPTETA